MWHYILCYIYIHVDNVISSLGIYIYPKAPYYGADSHMSI